MVIAMFTCALISICMIVFGKGILSCFITVDAEQGAEALAVAYQYLFIMSVWLPVLYVLHIFRSTVQGLGNTVLPMGSGIAEFIMRTVSAFTLPGLIGSVGVMYAEILAWVGADLILVPSYFYVMSKIKKQRAAVKEDK